MTAIERNAVRASGAVSFEQSCSTCLECRNGKNLWNADILSCKLDGNIKQADDSCESWRLDFDSIFNREPKKDFEFPSFNGDF